MHQYVYNQLDFNPAYAGSQGQMNVFAMWRKQWVGFGEGAPQLMYFNVDVPIGYKTPAQMSPLSKFEYSHGVGLHFGRDALGFSAVNGLMAVYSGRFHLRALGSLAFGVGVQFFNDRLQAQWRAPGTGAGADPAIPEASGSFFTADVSFGLYWTHARAYFGLSALHLLGHDVRKEINKGLKLRQSALFYGREVYLVSGYQIALPKKWAVEPSFLLGTDFSQYHIWLKGLLHYNNIVTFGVSYHVTEAVGVYCCTLRCLKKLNA